jgi:hypothetical protein
VTACMEWAIKEGSNIKSNFGSNKNNEQWTYKNKKEIYRWIQF